MIESIVSLVASKVGALVFTILTLLGVWLNLKWQKRKRAQAEARADGLETTVQHKEDVGQVDAVTQKAEDQIHEEAQGDTGLVDYFKSGGLRRDSKRGPS